MKLMSLKQFEKKSRGSLMRFIIGYLKTQSKKQVAIFAYTLAKSKLPRLRTIKQKRFGVTDLFLPLPVSEYPRLKRVRKMIRQKKKRKFSRKQLAAQRLFAKRAKAGTLRRR